MKQQWALMLEQLNVATRIILEGHQLIPAWRIKASDGVWLVLTRFDRDKPGHLERVLGLMRRSDPDSLRMTMT